MGKVNFGPKTVVRGHNKTRDLIGHIAQLDAMMLSEQVWHRFTKITTSSDHFNDQPTFVMWLPYHVCQIFNPIIIPSSCGQRSRPWWPLLHVSWMPFSSLIFRSRSLRLGSHCDTPPISLVASVWGSSSEQAKLLLENFDLEESEDRVEMMGDHH